MTGYCKMVYFNAIVLNDFCMKPLFKYTCALSVPCVLQGPVTCPNASFTDLAEIVSRIELAKPALVDGETAT